jgi:excisionase family DNA binding protein
MEEKNFYNVKEAAEILDVNPETVRRWVRSGEIFATMSSKRSGWVISQKSLEDFLVRHHVKVLNKYSNKKTDRRKKKVDIDVRKIEADVINKVLNNDLFRAIVRKEVETEIARQLGK